jgi:3-hydroxyacyl-CoA dehydrogenase
MSADYRREGSVALITLNNPPVNGLGLATRTAAVDGIRRALADDAVSSIVITGAGKAFSGGADIREFNTPQALVEPTLHTLISTAESSPKPVIAALHSVCMGGGLELALACHYRIATTATKIALPEVKLGLLPGAGGTQRLPRAVGLEAALDFIVSGQPIAAGKLAGTALFDLILPEGQDFTAAALAFAQTVALVRPLPKVRERSVQHAPGADPMAVLENKRAAVYALAHGLPAPLACVNAVAAAVTMPFEQGLQYETGLFMQLIETTESKALRHAFFAERQAAKVADLPSGTAMRTIASAAVVGAGTMGSGIAMSFASAGIPVVLFDQTREALDRGIAAIRKIADSKVARGKLTQEQAEQRLALVTGSLDWEALADADIAVEAVYEEMAAKQQVFAQLDRVLRPGAILASNTSTLDLNVLAAGTSRAQDVVGTHFFSPAHVMKLLEVVRGDKTAPDVLASTLALARKLGKTAVVARVCDGFIGNRMVEQYLRQATFLLEAGCLPEQVDRAAEQFGLAMGPFRMADLAGNDIGWAIRKRRRAENPAMTYSATADLLCEMGRFGQKTGSGWYDYRPGERKALPSAAVADMILGESARLGIARRDIDDEEIVERLVYSLVNEGARILDEGIAQRASDIDVVYLTGYGFPAYRGGPMFCADTVGLPRVLAAIEGFAGGAHGEAWPPAPLLVRLVAEGKRFNS